MGRRFSALVSTTWICISFVLLLLPKIYCEDQTPCGEIILLDSDRPTAEITSTGKQYYRPGGNDDDATKECLWYFRSPPGTTIRLDIVTLDPMTNPLIVYDGPGVEEDDGKGIQLVGSQENSFISSGRGLTCKLPTQSNDINQEYTVAVQASLLQGEISIEAANPGECGGTIYLNENSTTSLFNITNSYPSGGTAYCNWYIYSPSNTYTIVEFVNWQSLDDRDYLYIYDSRGRVIFRATGEFHQAPYPVVSDSYVRLRLDAYYSVSDTYFGVKISYTDELRHNTDGVFQSSGGVIELNENTTSLTVRSTNFAFSYIPYMYNYWFVTGPVGRRLKVEFHQLNSGDFSVCDSSSTSRITSRFSRPSVMPEDRVSTENAVTLYFHLSYGTYQGVGVLFTISITDEYPVVGQQTCGGTIELDSYQEYFVLNSPYYYSQQLPSGYTDCYWYVTSPAGKQVQLVWLDIETSSEYLKVYDHSSSTIYLVSQFRGNVDADLSPVVSTRGGITIYLDDSSSGTNGRGFLANVSLSDTPYYASPASCGGSIRLTQSSPNLTISTPYYYQLSTTNVDMDCYWYITSPSGKQVQLTVLDLETRSETIYINDHTTSTISSYRMSELSGRLVSPATVLSSRGGVTVYYADYSSAYNGPGLLFEARILDAVPSSISGFCGGVIPLSTSTPTVTTTTPLFYQPSSSYVNIDCWWYVTSPSGKQVEMSIHDLQTENEQVYVYDYPSSLSYQVSRLRGNVSDSTVVSTRGGFSVVFDDTSSSGNGPGFAMDVALTDEFTWDDEGIDSCGQTVYLDSSSPSIVLRTPTYPIEVLNDQYYCYWYLTCPYGYRISLLFHDFDTYSSSHFTVYDYSSTSSTYQLAEISSRSLPGTAAIQSSSNRLTVYYYDADWSDVTKQRGVLADAAMVPEEEPVWDRVEPMSSCGSAITLTGQENRITLTTPDYPDVNGDYYECTWFVQCPSQTAVRIDFNDFWVDSSGYLRVYDGPTTGYSVLLHSTGSSLPSSVVSSSNTMTTYYYNNRGTSGKGASFVISCVFEANVDCDSTSMTVFLDRRLLSNGTNAEDVHFQDDDCVGIDHDTTQIVLYTRYDRCSTVLEETETSIIYSNVVTYYTPRPIPGTEITRESILKMNVQCELDRHRLLGDSFVPKTGEISFNETGYGDFSLRLDRYTDATFDEFADDDDEDIILGEHLYFAVNLTSVAGLTVFIENCWATPSQYPNDAKSYTFLDNGCSEDPTMHMIYFPDPSFAPFVIDAFTFIEENPQVFIHCEVLVCNDNDPSSRCAQGCQTRFRRGSRYTRGTSSTPHLISNGPLSTFQTMHVAGAQNSDGSPVGLESGLLIGVLACVTCLIVAMVAILLYMMPSRRISQHLYHRVNINDDDE